MEKWQGPVTVNVWRWKILSVHTAVLIHAKKFGFVTTSIELNEHDFWARCTVRMQWKQVPVQLDCHLKSKPVKTWQTEVWRWSFLCNEKLIVDVSMYLTTLRSKQGWNMLVLKGTATRLFNVATAKFDSVKDVWLPILSLRIWRQTFRQALPHECETSLYSQTFLQALPHECETSL